jgi:hypothetical protein
MQRLEVSGAVRPLKWPLGVKWLRKWSITGTAGRTRHIVYNFYIISRAVCKVVNIIRVETKLTVAVIF